MRLVSILDRRGRRVLIRLADVTSRAVQVRFWRTVVPVVGTIQKSSDGKDDEVRTIWKSSNRKNIEIRKMEQSGDGKLEIRTKPRYSPCKSKD